MGLFGRKAFDLFQSCSQVIPKSRRVIRSHIMNGKTNEETLVFVYGTLRRGGSNAWRMEGATFIEAATALGHLYHVDWYPGAIFDQAAETVILGELYTIPSEPLRQLDVFEGEEYERIKIVVMTSSQQPCEAWAWQYLPPTEHLSKIPSGDWFSV